MKYHSHLVEFLFDHLVEREPKPTDIPATGDVLTIDGVKYKLVSITSAGTRDPNGFKVYRFVGPDGEKIDIPSTALKKK